MRCSNVKIIAIIVQTTYFCFVDARGIDEFSDDINSISNVLMNVFGKESGRFGLVELDGISESFSRILTPQGKNLLCLK